jgi:hypothetical protein
MDPIPDLDPKLLISSRSPGPPRRVRVTGIIGLSSLQSSSQLEGPRPSLSLYPPPPSNPHLYDPLRSTPSPPSPRKRASSPSSWNLYRGKAPPRRARPRRSVDCLEKNLGVQILRPSPPCSRLPRRKRAPLGRPDVLDALRKRLDHGDAVQHNPGDCLIFGGKIGVFGEKSGMTSVI